jgi:ComF family protein
MPLVLIGALALIALVLTMRLRTVYRGVIRQIEIEQKYRAQLTNDYYHQRALALIRKESTGTGGLITAQVFPCDGALDERRSCGVYRDSKSSLAIKRLLELKYEHVSRRDGELIATQLAGYLVQQFTLTDWQPTIIVSVPSTEEKLRERGFNQARLIACEMSHRIHVWYADILIRAKNTTPQARLKTKEERIENLHGAFEVRGNVNGARVLLIDDIATTGSTLQECAVALKQAGADKVWALTLASGRR